MGLTMSTAQVGKWLKNEGDAVKKGEPIVEVMTDKLSNLIESPSDGILLKIVAHAGTDLQAGSLLCYIGQAGEAVPGGASGPPPAVDAAAPAAAAPSGAAPAPDQGSAKVVATPVAKALAKDKGVDLTQVKGTGPGGRITKEDVEAYLEAGPAPAPAAAAAAPAQPEVLKVIPYVGMRQAIGRNLHKSWTEIPRVTQHCQVHADALIKFRAKLNEGLEKEKRYSITDLLVKAIASAAVTHPDVNALFDGSEIKIMRQVNLGVAVALPDGLVVPVVRDVTAKSLSAVSSEIKELAGKARGGSLTPADMAGGTLTLSNLGGYNSVDTFNPIINPPQVAIIGVGRSRTIPVVKNGQIEPGVVISLSVSHDHRVLDGAPVAEFLATLSGLIEEPLKILV
jgi:pyruvate dehydrogenase E2 component (dihydrolipoamide acetyltransferase)